ncbi:hypothetical protein HPULCUR_006016 [Helicostylum pulchrum]|uniref:Tyrosine specific protein phosphatases domain-containing protein n=1 Tax=Helicostylum pulchrum TaxID=562976 RepID=A0ABP9Y0P5_9FUNG
MASPTTRDEQVNNTTRYYAPAKVPKTSISHPINISWVIPPDVLHYLSTTDFPSDFDLYDFMNPYVKEIFINSNTILQPVKKIRGNLCLSSCPGKKVRLSGPVRGRATIDRDLDLDFERMRMFGITMLVCCLDDIEMEFLGAPWPKYELAAKDKGMKIIRLPMREGGCPSTLKEVKDAITEVNKEIEKGNNVLVHCRGGVGRAGLFAGCWLLENSFCNTVEKAVYILRKQRSLKAIETMIQVEYLIKYRMELDKRRNNNIPFSKTEVTSYHGDLARFEENGSPTIHYIAEVEGNISRDPAFLQDGYSFFNNRKQEQGSNVYGFS